MAKGRKATRRGDAFRRRMTSALARHELTIHQARQLSDSDLRRRRGIGPKMIDAIRAGGGPAPPPSPHTSEGQAADKETDPVTRERRIVALERQVADLIAAVSQVQDLLRMRGIDRRGHPSSEEALEEDRHEPDRSQNIPGE